MAKRNEKDNKSFNYLSNIILSYVKRQYEGTTIESDIRRLAREIKEHTKTSASISHLSDAINKLAGKGQLKFVYPSKTSGHNAFRNTQKPQDVTHAVPSPRSTEPPFPDKLAGRVEKDKLGRYILVPLAKKYKDENILLIDNDAKNYEGKIVGVRIFNGNGFHDVGSIVRPLEERGETKLISRILALAFDADIDPTPVNTVDNIMKEWLAVSWADILLERNNLPQDMTESEKNDWAKDEWRKNLNAALNSDQPFPTHIVEKLAQAQAIEYLSETRILSKLLDGLHEYKPVANKPDLNMRIAELTAFLDEWASIPTKVSENDPEDKWSIENMKSQFSNFFDARNLPFVTIDPLTCKDMDDAVCVVKLPNGGCIQYTAISLVSAYIQDMPAIMKSALNRGNSSYFADMVAPMLPPRLSNIIGSLNPNEDRLSFITSVEYDKDGNIVSETMAPGVIKSRHKFAYEDVDKIISGDEEERAKHDQEILDSIDQMRVLEDILRPMREKNGSTKFMTREFTYRLNKDRTGVDELFADNSTKAHEMVETCMLTANEVFARYTQENEIPITYRVEDPIEPEKVMQIRAFLDTMHIPFNLGETVDSYGDLQVAINEAIDYAFKRDGELFANIVSENIIKCLPRARYDTQNVGHFALNFEAYAHTTSPIRRFSDTLNQIQVLAHMAHMDLPYTTEELNEMCEQINKTERNSAELEMQVDDFLNAWYVQQRLNAGEDLTEKGYISRVDRDKITITTSYGKVIIELAESQETSPFRLSPDLMSITNNVTGLSYKVGQSLEVKPTGVDISTCKVAAEIVRERGVEMTKHLRYEDEIKTFTHLPYNPQRDLSNLITLYKTSSPITIHEHTLKSDGNMDLRNLVKYAVDRNFALVGAADHNYISLSKLNEEFGVTPQETKLAYFPLDLSSLGEQYKDKSILYTNVCEFTTRDNLTLNIKENKAKYHFLIVGAKIDDQNSPLMQLLQFKRQNDIDYDLAPIEYLFRYQKVPFPAREINQYRTLLHNSGYESTEIHSDDVMTLFDQHPHLIKKLGLKRSTIKKMLNCIPTIRRLNIPDDILIDAAHASGALVLMAHPAKNLRRIDDISAAVEHLISLGIDGFNIKEYEDPAINKIIKEVCASAHATNPLILDAGGNDCHSLEDYDNAEFSKFTLAKCRNFVTELECLQQARIDGKLTHRDYQPNLDAVNEFIEGIKIRTTGLDYYEAFKAKVDQMFKIEELKADLVSARDKTKDAYYTELLLKDKRLVNNNTPREVLDYLKSQRTVPISVVDQIIEGTFVPPESPESEKDAKRNHVSKDAVSSHNGGRHGNK